ncbi:MAG: exodeoxyribonuclease VII large subunit [Gammaproteobacteria bacterium]|nr:exodeoxyribonuclease VII large subunit [Gammaproteobacteria bacterium]
MNDPWSAPGAARTTVYTVARLNQEARTLLEDHYGRIWVEGEIADLSRPVSGHLYFVLKDERAQVRCALFRGAQRLCCPATNGLRVRVRARVSLYEGRGEFQLIIEEMEDAGEGALRRAFELLKQRLAAEGLFTPERKRPVPRRIRRIAVITSPDGAALHDILITLKRRFPAIALLVYPVPVQGTEAAPRIAQALALASDRQDCDVILLARGGGSLADLWPFNEEIVARAMAAARLPIVTGIGHEIDTTIADLIADQRAPTPTAAAELLSPDQALWEVRRAQASARLTRLCERALAERSQHLDDLRRRLRRALPHPLENLRHRWLQDHQRLAARSPMRRVADSQLRLARLRHALAERLSARLRTGRLRLQAARERLARHHPRDAWERLRLRTDPLRARLLRTLREALRTRGARLQHARQALALVGPAQVLARGYAIASRDSHIIRRAADVQLGDILELRLAEGVLSVQVINRSDS